MKKIARDSQNNAVEIISIDGQIPEGYTEVSPEEFIVEERNIARNRRLNQIRSRRDILLEKNDKMWLIASKKGESTTDIEADAQLLRDLPAGAESDLNALLVVGDIESYDPFPSMGLIQSYED